MKKIQARQEALSRRDLAQKELGANFAQNVLACCKDVRVVSGYLPLKDELDPVQAMTLLASHGIRVAIPIITKRHAPLGFALWHKDMELIPSDLGIKIPKNPEFVQPDLVLAPLLAFDRLGTRLGYGGGYYDRTLALLRTEKPVTYCGLAFSFQESPNLLPCEPTDIPLEIVVTEEGIRHLPEKAPAQNDKALV